MKRISVMLTVPLALSLLLCLCIGTAAADDHPTAGSSGSFYWYLQADGTLTLTTDERYASTATEHWNYDDVVHVVVEDNVQLNAHEFEAEHNLVDAVIGEGVNLSEYCFSGCSALEKVTMPSSMTIIGSSAFWYCSTLREITVPEGVSDIKNETFYACQSLEVVHVPSTLHSIEAAAFYGTGLTDVYYNGTRAQWGNVADSENLISREGVTFHFLADDSTPKDGIPVDEEHFPDDNFRAYVEENFDQDKDWWLTDEERDAVTFINIATNMDISSLEGLRYFWKLQSFSFHSNPVTEITLHGMPFLTYVDCTFNRSLTKLEIGGCYSLETIDCSNNALTELYVIVCPALTSLVCYNNQLQELDISDCGNLQVLSCFYNQLGRLDVSTCSNLQSLFCYSNQLTTLDVSANPDLTVLNCYDNQLTTLNVSSNTLLKNLSCSQNQLSALNVRNNTVLEELACFNNQIKTLSLTKNTQLKSLYCSNNQLSYLVLSANAALQYLSCANNRLVELDLSDNPALVSVVCNGNQLESLYLSSDATLTSLNCRDNHLTSLALPNLGVNFPYNNYLDRNYYVLPSARFDLSQLPEGFDLSKASNWAGGTVNGSILTATSNTITYQYDCGQGITNTFVLTLETDEIIAGGSCGDSLSWLLDADGSMVISGTGEMGMYDSGKGGYRPWQGYESEVKRLVIEEGVTSIGSCAFSRFEQLTSVSLPSTLQSIGYLAFEYCTSLPTLVIPEGVTYLAEDVFSGCEAIGKVVLPGTLGDWWPLNTSPFGNAGDKITVSFSSTNPYYEIVDGVIFRRSNHELLWYPTSKTASSYTIPSNTSAIHSRAFAYNQYIQQIIIPNSVQSIGYFAFGNCSALTEIILPASVTTTEDPIFDRCTNLKKLTFLNKNVGSLSIFREQAGNLPDITVYCYKDSVAYTAFNGIRPIVLLEEAATSGTLIVPASLTTIEAEAFTGGAFSSVELSEKTRYIRSKAFADCPYLTSIYIYNANCTIAADAFFGVSSLTIYGKEGSTAEAYADRWGYDFVALE